MKQSNYWMRKLSAFDAELIRMVESLTGKPCDPKNGGNHFFFEVDYSTHNDPEYIMAIWDAIEGRLGKRLISIKDNADRKALMVRVKFAEPSADEQFVPIPNEARLKQWDG